MFNEIGVDVEHHSYRTFLGLTSLIQISTSEKDYVVDPFPLWSTGNLTALNEVFGKYGYAEEWGHTRGTRNFFFVVIILI